MKTGTVLVATLFALTSLPFIGQQPPMDNPSNSPAARPDSAPGAQPPSNTPPGAPGAQPEQPATPEQPAGSMASPEASAAPAAPVAEMRPVNGELVSKLDSKTAKTGDDVVVQTKASVKTADGTEIPKGSKLVGHVTAVQPSTDGQNSQVVLKFDHAELAGGKNLPIQSQIQSIAPAGGDASASEPSDPGTAAMSRPSGGMAGSSAAGMPGAAPEAAPAAGSGEPAAGTVVARTGKIAIRAASIPGVLLANNEPGQQDPRLAQASSILLGAKKDVQLDGGTQMVLGVAASGGGTQ